MALRTRAGGPPSRVPPGARTLTPMGVFGAWNRGVSGPTFAGREHDLALFGRFAWRSKSVSHTIARLVATLANDVRGANELARAWDAEQRAAGLSWATRKRRRKTLQSFATFAIRCGVLPKEAAFAALEHDKPTNGSITARIDAAVDAALAAGKHRDAAMLSLVHETRMTLADMQRLTVGDLPLAHVSDRCALALSFAAGVRPCHAPLFAGRDHSRPIDGTTIHYTMRAYGFRGLQEIRGR